MKANLSNIQKIYSELPKRYVHENTTFDNYHLLTNLHFEHGWREVVVPGININQRLANDFILVNDIVTKLVIDLTSEEKTANLTNRITTAFTSLRQRALASSIGKPLLLGYDYIKEQADQYRYKYAVAKGNITDVFVSQMIANEALDFGITEQQMKDLVIDKFEQGESAYLSFTAMIERARTKALTMLEINDFAKAEAIVVMMENVPETLTMQDAEILTNQMLSI